MLYIIEDVLDNFIGQKVMTSILETIFMDVKCLKFGTRELLDQGYVFSDLTPKGYPENLDIVNFKLPKKGTPPIPIEVWKFKVPFRRKCPDENFYNLLNNIKNYTPEDSELWEEQKFFDFVDRLWIIYQPQQIAYLLISMIPLCSNFVQGFFMKIDDDPAQALKDYTNAQWCAIVTCTTAIILNLYEIIQMCSSGKYYLQEMGNWLDITAQVLYQTNSIWIIIATENSFESQTLYCWTLLFGFFKLY